MMAKMTVGFGVLLILLGGSFYIGTGMQFPTSLIPIYFGVVLCLCGVFANTENSKKRMLWMHVAVTFGLLGFLIPAVRVVTAYVNAHGEPFAFPAAIEEQAAMALICAIFTGLCVKSFIAARRGRIASA